MTGTEMLGVQERRNRPILGFCVAMAVALGTLGLGGCHGSGAPHAEKKTAYEPKAIVVLLDKTASIADQEGIYKTALATVLHSMKPGDSFRLAEITGASEDDFSFILNETLPLDPPYDPLTTNRSEYTDTINELKTVRTKTVETLIAKGNVELDKKPAAMMTDLFGALNMASLFLNSQHGRRHVLVVMSDMVEEDAHWRFNHVTWSDKLTKKILKHEQSLNLIPDLKGTTVVVIGARASDIARTQHIRQFWLTYFAAAHASITPDHYAHALLDWAIR